MLQFIIKNKDIITTIVGFICGLGNAALQYLHTGNITIEGLLGSLGMFIVCWFTGKTVPQTSK